MDKKHSEGTWKAIDKGMRESVVATIENTNEIPHHWKETLIAEIRAFPETVKAVRLDAHCHFGGGKKVLHMSLEPLF